LVAVDQSGKRVFYSLWFIRFPGVGSSFKGNECARRINGLRLLL